MSPKRSAFASTSTAFVSGCGSDATGAEAIRSEFHELLPGVKPNLGIRRSDEPIAGAVPRIYVMVEDPPALLAAAVERGATVLWEESTWEEFNNARYAAFRDPWGAEVCLWRDRGTYGGAGTKSS